MRNFRKLIRGGRRLRTAAAAIVGLAVLAVVAYFAPAWATAVTGLVCGSILGGLIGEEFLPPILRIVRAESPVGIELGDDADVYSKGWSLAFLSDLEDSQHPPAGIENREARGLLVSSGGFDIGSSHLALATRGRTTDVLTITDIEAVVIRRFPTVATAIVTSPSAGEQSVISLGIDLDEPKPIARRIERPRPPLSDEDLQAWDVPVVDVAVPGTFTDPYFNDHFVNLARGEIQFFRIEARSRRTACEWRLKISLLVDGKPQAMIVDRDGESEDGVPFRTSPEAEGYQFPWVWAWFDPPAASLKRIEDTSL